MRISQQLLGENFSWDHMIDIAADIYSGVSHSYWFADSRKKKKK
jgi:hypothetical protein